MTMARLVLDRPPPAYIHAPRSLVLDPMRAQLSSESGGLCRSAKLAGSPGHQPTLGSSRDWGFGVRVKLHRFKREKKRETEIE